MTTANPRITVTLQPATYAVLQRLAQATGDSMSASVAELIDVSIPVFERVIMALEAAKSIEDNAKTEIKAGLSRAQDKLEGQLGIMFEQLDEGIRPLLTEAEKVRRRPARPSERPAPGKLAPHGAGRSAGGSGRKSTPRPVTRGVGRSGSATSSVAVGASRVRSKGQKQGSKSGGARRGRV